MSSLTRRIQKRGSRMGIPTNTNAKYNFRCRGSRRGKYSKSFLLSRREVRHGSSDLGGLQEETSS